MILIELHGFYGPIWVNPNYIASICPGDPGSNVFMGNDANSFPVRETPEEILTLIQSALNQ